MSKECLMYIDDAGVEHDLSLWPERHAVIQAAKALLKDGLPLQLRVARVTDAVHALLAAEEPYTIEQYIEDEIPERE